MKRINEQEWGSSVEEYEITDFVSYIKAQKGCGILHSLKDLLNDDNNFFTYRTYYVTIYSDYSISDGLIGQKTYYRVTKSGIIEITYKTLVKRINTYNLLNYENN